MALAFIYSLRCYGQNWGVNLGITLVYTVYMGYFGDTRGTLNT